MAKCAKMNEDLCYKSFKAYEAYLDQELKAGRLTREQTRSFLISARKNYKNQNHNKQLDLMNV
jgi:hypothetical protein